MDAPTSLRSQIYARMQAALGIPEISHVSAGDIYRWTLPRHYDLTLYVTMDSPEHPDLAHIMLSDGPRYQDKPVVSFLVYSLQEADALIVRILEQWKRTVPRP